MNLGEDTDGTSRFDNLQAVAGSSFDGLSVDAVPLGEIGLDFRNALAELAGRSDIVVVAVVVDADSEVDEALEEPAVWLPRGGPDFFQEFVAFEKLAAVEEVDALLEEALGVLHDRLSVYSTGNAWWGCEYDACGIVMRFVQPVVRNADEYRAERVGDSAAGGWAVASGAVAYSKVAGFARGVDSCV